MKNSSEKVDVAVVGAGPAGSSMAIRLAEAGVDVMLVDKCKFPRPKTCGDGVTPAAEKVLHDLGLASWLEGQNLVDQKGFLLSSPNGTTVRTGPSNATSLKGCLIRRTALDAALVERAVAVGARFREETTIRGFEGCSGRGVTLLTDQDGREGLIKARLVVGAGGAHCPIAKQLHPNRVQPEAFAVRSYFEGDEGTAGLLEIHWTEGVLPGYAWIFHHGGGIANVGVGAFRSDIARFRLDLRALLRRFVNESKHGQRCLKHAHATSKPQGFPLRMDAERVRPIADGILLVGEAAGLVHPLTGEGIGPALDSGLLAAEHARIALEQGRFTMSSLSGYARAFRRRYLGRHVSAKVLRLFMTSPAVINAMLGRAARRHELAQTLQEVISGTRWPTAVLDPFFWLSRTDKDASQVA